MSGHTEPTPVPWVATESNGFGTVHVRGADSPPVAIAEVLQSDKRHSAEANARRIVAAVNACADIPTEALEDGAVAGMLFTLQRMIGLDGHYYGCPAAGDRPTNCSPACNRLRAAIAEATGATP
jgi:hypothetical protein